MKAPPVPAVFAEPGVFCFLYKPSPWEEGAPVRTLGRMSRFWIGFVIRRGNFAACGRRVTLPPAARRRKVRLSPFPPDGENCDRSLAPPLPGEPAALGFCAGLHREQRWIGQNAAGDGSKWALRAHIRLPYPLCRFATSPPDRESRPRTPLTGVIPLARQKISGAQNLSGHLNSCRPTGGWLRGKLKPVRFPFCAWLCPAGRRGGTLGRPISI